MEQSPDLMLLCLFRPPTSHLQSSPEQPLFLQPCLEASMQPPGPATLQRPAWSPKTIICCSRHPKGTSAMAQPLQNIPGAGVSLLSPLFHYWPQTRAWGHRLALAEEPVSALTSVLSPPSSVPLPALENVPGFPIARCAGLHLKQQNL